MHPTRTTLDELAEELDVTRETVITLVGQLADDPDLYDEATGSVSETGAALIRAQVVSGSGVEAELAEAAAAQDAYERAKQRRVVAVRRCRAAGASWQQIADAMPLRSREAARAIAAQGS